MSNTLRNISVKLGITDPYTRGLLDTALHGDVSRAIEIADKTCPKHTWTLKKNRAMLTHDVSHILDVDWIKGKNTGEALILACLETKK